MKDSNTLSLNSTIYERITQIGIRGSEREEAIYALGLGEAIADAILVMVNGIKNLSAGTAAKPGYKHRLAA